MIKEYSNIISEVQNYYNSPDAEAFYSSIWGGEDIHIGIYQSDNDSIVESSRRTVEKLSSYLSNLNSSSCVLDMGSGYGGAARYLAKKYGCKVVCLNLSHVQNSRNSRLNEEQNLGRFITVQEGNFEEIPFPDTSFDVVWSQDAILHSGSKEKVFDEVYRVLKKGGDFIFTDIMKSDLCPDGFLQPILDRIHLKSMGSPGFYGYYSAKIGLNNRRFIDLSSNLWKHYSRVLDKMKQTAPENEHFYSAVFLKKMSSGLEQWILGGKKGYIKWGIFHFKK